MATAVGPCRTLGPGLFCLITLGLAIPPAAARDPATATKSAKPGDLPADVAAVFEQHGLRLVGTGLALEAEAEATKAVKDLARYKKSLMLADRERCATEAELAAAKQAAGFVTAERQLEAYDVECVVLGPEATEAPQLLGMSFLGQFKFELDAAQAQLKMVKVDSGEPAPTAKGVKKKRPK